MLIVGVTGGIGSGKSVVCRVYRLLGYPVFDCDLEAKRLYRENDDLRDFMIALFGDDIYIHHKHKSWDIDRKKLAEKIFSDTALLQQVEARVHRLVEEQLDRWLLNQTQKIAILESAILFKTPLAARCALFLQVEAPMEKRVERVMARDKTSREAVMARIAQQEMARPAISVPICTICNDDSTPLLPQLLAIEKDFFL